MFHLLKRKKNTASSLPIVLFTLVLTSALQSWHLTLVFFNHQGQNRIGQSDYRRIPQDTAGSLDMDVFNGI